MHLTFLFFYLSFGVTLGELSICWKTSFPGERKAESSGKSLAFPKRKDPCRMAIRVATCSTRNLGLAPCGTAMDRLVVCISHSRTQENPVF